MSHEDESVESAFKNLHNFELPYNMELPKCLTCKTKPLFIRFSCFCSYCIKYNEEMADEPVNEYILHCFQCHKCLCKASPESCFGCVFIKTLLTETISFQN